MKFLLLLAGLSVIRGSLSPFHQSLLAPQMEIFVEFRDTLRELEIVTAQARSGQTQADIFKTVFSQHGEFEDVKTEYNSFLTELISRLREKSDREAKQVVQAAILTHIDILQRALDCTLRIREALRVAPQTSVLENEQMTEYDRMLRVTLGISSGLIDILQGISSEEVAEEEIV